MSTDVVSVTAPGAEASGAMVLYRVSPDEFLAIRKLEQEVFDRVLEAPDPDRQERWLAGLREILPGLFSRDLAPGTTVHIKLEHDPRRLQR